MTVVVVEPSVWTNLDLDEPGFLAGLLENNHTPRMF
jgi:hypothetical protein